MSSKTLTRHFHRLLNNPPKPNKNKIINKSVHLKIDAKHFGRWGCVIVFKENQNIVFWQFCNRENYRNYLVSFSKYIELGFFVKK